MARSDLSGAVLDGRYRVIEPVAEGAMGVVYRAERVKLGRAVAIKVLHDVLPGELSARKRFEIEAMAMAKLEHPHCASVLDVGVHDDQPYVVMDFVSGMNLKDLVETGAQPIARAAEIVRQVLSGLAHAHEHGIIHRDIKPANIVLSQKTGLGDHVKILDFGLARFHDTGQNLTTGIVVGTPAYMAPEQIRGVLFDHRIDLYACGVLLYELLTGHKPYHSERDDPIEVCKMHLSLPIPRLADKRPGVDYGQLDAVLERALAKAPEDRFGSAHEFVVALDVAVPRRPSLPAVATLSTMTPPAGLPTRAQVTPFGDDSAVQVQSADVMSALSEGPPRAELRAPTKGVATSVLEAGESPPGTFLGMPVTRKAARTPSGPVPTRSEPAPSGPVPTRSEPAPSGPVPTRSEPSESTHGAAIEARDTTPDGPPPLAARDTTPDGAPPLAKAPLPAAPASPRRRYALTAAIVGVLLSSVLVFALTRPHAPAPAPAATGSDVGRAAAPAVDPTLDILARADALASQGNKDAAIDVLNRARRQYPDRAELAYASGKLSFSRFYWSEGLRSFRDVLRIDPAYRTDPELLKIVLRGFLITPGYNEDLASFLREDIGAPAVPMLEETARDHPNAETRRRAAAELRRYR